MKQSEWTIESNLPIAYRTFEMVLRGDTVGILPGQFVDVALPDFFLRRPLSVCDIEDDRLTLIYKVVGAGTSAMSAMQAGTRLDILTGLGNGYNLTLAGHDVLLVGGGVGIPPLVFAVRQLLNTGRRARVVMGFNTAREVFGEELFRRMGCSVEVCTMDGSYGKKGMVTDLLTASEPFYYACGPLPMLRALVQKVGTNGQVSMEERMGCGVGLCVGCSIRTRHGIKRVCKEGPVFSADEIQWM